MYICDQLLIDIIFCFRLNRTELPSLYFSYLLLPLKKKQSYYLFDVNYEIYLFVRNVLFIS